MQLWIILEDLCICTYNDFIDLIGFSCNRWKFLKDGIAKLIPWLFWRCGCIRINGYQMAQGVCQDVVGSFNVVKLDVESFKFHGPVVDFQVQHIFEQEFLQWFVVTS